MSRFFSASLSLVGGLGLLLSACNPDSGKKSAAATPQSAASSLTPTPDASGTWYQQYRGVLPGSADSVTVELQSLGMLLGETTATRLVGTYSGPDGQPYELAGSISGTAPDSLLLRDTSPEKGSRASTDADWLLKRRGPDLVGTYHGQPVRLRSARPAVALVSKLYQDSVAANSRAPFDTIYGRISLHALVPADATSPLAAPLLRRLRGDTTEAKPAPTLAGLWQQQRRRFAEDYQADVQGLLPDLEADTSSYLPFAMLRYQDQTTTAVLWNQGQLLSLGFGYYSYAGGAHGNYGTFVQSFDARTGRALRYSDIFRPGTEARLRQVLTSYARPALGLKPNEPLTHALFKPTLDLTRNVCLTSGGVLFVYTPYEIASYAQGEIRIFVPFQALRPLLQPNLPVAGGGEVAGR